MSLLIGIVLALASAALAATIKFDRRTFYAVVLIISATYYVLFALMAGSLRAMIIESLVMTTFVLFAGVGFRLNPWLIVAGFAAHGTLDLVHGLLISNPGVPAWWPPFCMAYDVVAAGVYARYITRTRSLTRRHAEPARTILTPGA
jgi:hypothetical protein